MTEETDTPQGGADDAVASEVVETNPEATAGQDNATETADQPDAGEATEKPKQVPWFQKRIDEVTAKKYEAEREAAYWRGQAEASKRGEPIQQPEASKPPTLAQFDYDEEAFATALATYYEDRTEKALDRKLAERTQKQSEEQKNTTALTKLNEGGAKYPDFIAAVSAIPANEAVRDFLIEEPNAVNVLYELGKDNDALGRFNSLSPYQQAIELGRRAAAPPKATSRPIPPAPIQTVAGLASGIGKKMEDMSFAEFAAMREEQEKTRN